MPTLTPFKPRKSTYGFKITLDLENLQLCAYVQDLLLKSGTQQGTGKDYWLDLQSTMSTCPTLLIYVNSKAIHDALLPHSQP